MMKYRKITQDLYDDEDTKVISYLNHYKLLKHIKN